MERLHRTRQVKIFYRKRNDFCLGLKRLEAERFKTKPDAGDKAIELKVDEQDWLGYWAHARRNLLTHRKCNPKARLGVPILH